MTTQTIIPAGYRLSIESWENDGDNYKTTVHEGLSKERVEFVLEMCKLFYSVNGYPTPGFGNMYEPSEHKLQKVVDAVCELFTKHRSVLNETELNVIDPTDSDADDLCDLIMEIVGDYLDTGDYAFRVYDTAKVEYIPHEITMDDVTGNFEV